MSEQLTKRQVREYQSRAGQLPRVVHSIDFPTARWPWAADLLHWTVIDLRLVLFRLSTFITMICCTWTFSFLRKCFINLVFSPKNIFSFSLLAYTFERIEITFSCKIFTPYVFSYKRTCLVFFRPIELKENKPHSIQRCMQTDRHFVKNIFFALNI